VALILHETDATWAGSLLQRKDTCAVAALSISAQRKRQPVLWSARRLPSDAFAVAAAPHGGVLVLTPSLLIYQNKARAGFLGSRLIHTLHCHHHSNRLQSPPPGVFHPPFPLLSNLPHSLLFQPFRPAASPWS